MIKLVKTILSAIAIIMIITVPMNVRANTLPNIDTEEIGSIKITLDDVKKGSKENVPFAIYKVAELNNGLLELVGNYKETHIDLNTITTANDLEKVSVILSKVNETAIQNKSTQADGTLIFDDLKVGAYLIVATDTSNYDDISPYIVSIPTFNEVDGTMAYDIESKPKHTPKPELPPTGDNNNLRIFVLSCMVSVAFLIMIIKYKKFKRQGK